MLNKIINNIRLKLFSLLAINILGKCLFFPLKNQVPSEKPTGWR